MPISRLTQIVHDKLVEFARSGCTYRSMCNAVGVNHGTFNRWLHEGLNPDNIRQRRLRLDIIKARAEAEIQALKNIQTAGLDPARWAANAWYLTNCIRGRYLKTARALKPEMNVTMADVARDLNDGDHQDGRIRFRCCLYCGVEFEVRKDRRSKFCSKQCRQLDTLSIRNQGQVIGSELIPALNDDHDQFPNGEVSNGILTH